MPFRTCDVDALADHLRAQAPAAVGVSGVRHARTGVLADRLRALLPGVRVHDGALLFDGGPDDRFDARVWLEESGTHLVKAAQAEARPAGRAWRGRWYAQAPPRTPAQEAHQEAVERQRARADAVLVALGGWPGQVRLRFFADYSDFALWDDEGNAGGIEGLLPITEELRRRITAWALADDAVRTHQEQRAHDAERQALVTELRQRLGPGYRIE